MKKTNIIILSVALLFCAAVAYAESPEAQLLSLLSGSTENIDQGRLEQIISLARKVTNDELRLLNDDLDFYKEVDEKGRLLSGITYYIDWVLAYGDKHGTFDLGEHRYHGYTAKGESYTNWLFRPDFSDIIQIDQANWVEKPEKNDDVIYFVTKIMGEKEGLKQNNFDLQRTTQKYRKNIAVGLLLLRLYLPDYYQLNPETVWDRDWENYVHILQPPSKYSFGTGRMFRWMENGTMRYMDVPLAPEMMLEMDFSVTLKEEIFRGQPGEVIESTATFALNPQAFYYENAKLRLYLNTSSREAELPFAPVEPSKKLDSNKYTFQPGEKLEVRFNFTVPNESAEIVAKIDRVFDGRTWIETDTDNNEDRAPIVGLYDVKVKIIPDDDEYTSLDGDDTTVSYKVRITRKDSVPGDIEVSLSVNDPNGRFTDRFILGPGYKDIPFDFQAGAGSYTIEAEAWPVGRTDAYPNDNIDAVSVTVNSKKLNIDSKIKSDLIDGGPIYKR